MEIKIIQIKLGERYIFKHKGSIRDVEIYVDDFDDICVLMKDNFRKDLNQICKMSTKDMVDYSIRKEVMKKVSKGGK